MDNENSLKDIELHPEVKSTITSSGDVQTEVVENLSKLTNTEKSNRLFATVILASLGMLPVTMLNLITQGSISLGDPITFLPVVTGTGAWIFATWKCHAVNVQSYLEKKDIKVAEELKAVPFRKILNGDRIAVPLEKGAVTTDGAEVTGVTLVNEKKGQRLEILTRQSA